MSEEPAGFDERGSRRPPHEIFSGAPAARDDNVARLRVPPHSIEAEQSVLGGLLLENTAWDRVGDLLTDVDFFRYEHRLIYAAIGSLLSACRPADTITVYEYLDGMGKSEECGGLPYLNNLQQSVPSAANIRRYAEIVRERSILRKTIAASDEIATAAFNTQGRSVDTILQTGLDQLHQLAELRGRSNDGVFDIEDLVVEILDDVQEKADKGCPEITGVPTGFYDWDRITSGLQPSDLVVIAGRPGTGKTAFAVNIAENVAVKELLPVVIYSMEMGAKQLAMRMVSSIGLIPFRNLQTGRVGDAEWSRLTNAVEQLGNASIVIDETPALTPAELRMRAKKQARRFGRIGLVIIDYTQLMSGTRPGETFRSQEISEITRGQKLLAKELQCPVIALSQVGRSVDARTDKRPMMSDLKDGGSIEQDADMIGLLYRDEVYNKDTPEPGVAELGIAKNRNGPTETVKFAFLSHITKFTNLAPGAHGA